MFYAGIDWADEEHQVCLLDERGKELERFKILHSADGMAELKERLLKRAGSPDMVACLLETSRGLLVAFLLENQFPVYPVNPTAVDGRRNPARAKTDPIDARILAKIGFSDLDSLRRLQPDSEVIRELKVLTQDQDRLMLQRIRLSNQLVATLKEYYPAALTLFTKIHHPIGVAFLQRYPTLEGARQATTDELYAFYKDRSPRASHASAERLYRQLHQAWPTADPPLVRGKARLVVSLCRQIAVILEDLKAYDKAITELFKSHPDYHIFASLPCGGPRLAVRLLAGWGDDRSRYIDAGAVQALAGTCPVARESGKRLNHPRRRRACLKWLRRTFHLFAFQTSMNVDWCATYYQAKREQGKGHTEALRCLANVWVRIIHAMWLKGEPYNETAFVQAQQAHKRAA